MPKVLKRFATDESGAVTVDWVILTASVVAMSAVSIYMTRNASGELMDSAGSALAAETAIFEDTDTGN